MNMKIVTILLVLTNLSGCFSGTKEKTGLEGKPLPSFTLLLADSTTHFSTSDIPSGSPIVLFLFGPFCPYSRAEMEDIVNNIQSLKDIRFYIFTTASYPDFLRFYTDYHLNKYSNLTVGIDYNDFFSGYFKAT